MLRIAEDKDEKKKSRPASDGGRRDKRWTRVDCRLEQRSSNETTTRVAYKAELNPNRTRPTDPRLHGKLPRVRPATGALSRA